MVTLTQDRYQTPCAAAVYGTCKACTTLPRWLYLKRHQIYWKKEQYQYRLHGIPL
jgi:hypothetical protein